MLRTIGKSGKQGHLHKTRGYLLRVKPRHGCTERNAQVYPEAILTSIDNDQIGTGGKGKFVETTENDTQDQENDATGNDTQVPRRNRERYTGPKLPERSAKQQGSWNLTSMREKSGKEKHRQSYTP